jgi:cell division initiation protein
MKITPVDVAHKTFGKKIMGLDPAEVQEFIQLVAEQMEALIHERNSLKEQMRDKELQLVEFKDRDQMLKSTITTASQMADRIRQDAEREAKLIINDAMQRAENLVRDSRDSISKSYQEMTELKRMRAQFEVNMKALCQAHLSLLEQGERFLGPAQTKVTSNGKLEIV